MTEHEPCAACGSFDRHVRASDMLTLADEVATVVVLGAGAAVAVATFMAAPPRPDPGLGLDPRDPLMVGGEVILALVMLFVGGRIVASRVFGLSKVIGGPRST